MATKTTARDRILAAATDNGWTVEIRHGDAYLTRGTVTVRVVLFRSGGVEFAQRSDTAEEIGSRTKDKAAVVVAWLSQPDRLADPAVNDLNTALTAIQPRRPAGTYNVKVVRPVIRTVTTPAAEQGPSDAVRSFWAHTPTR